MWGQLTELLQKGVIGRDGQQRWKDWTFEKQRETLSCDSGKEKKKVRTQADIEVMLQYNM